MAQTITIKDTRNNLADIVNQVAIGEDTFIITKFGKPKAMIVPISQKTILSKAGIKKSFGAWKNRKDIQDSAKWAADLRAKMSTRYE